MSSNRYEFDRDKIDVLLKEVAKEYCRLAGKSYLLRPCELVALTMIEAWKTHHSAWVNTCWIPVELLNKTFLDASEA